MTNLATILVGPLVAPECQRSASRGWVFLSRTLMALLVGLVSLISLGWWAINQQYERSYQPDALMPVTAIVIEFLAVILAMILAPAVLAGSLAGEKERGSIGLLLSTRVDSREIVLGRTLGKLSLVGSLLLACLPFQVLFALLNDLPWPAFFAFLALPVAVGFGAGGLGVAASAVAKRGRNALMAIYFLEVLFLIGFGLASTVGLAWASDLLRAINPFATLAPLVRFGASSGALATIASWLAMGVSGIVFASWKLRSSYLRLVDGKIGGRSVRRRLVPAVSEQSPMIWKERYIERVNALGWFGRVLNGLVVVYLVAGSLGMAGYAIYQLSFATETNAFDFAVGWIDRLFAEPAPLLCALLQLTAGLRASVAISSERERGTWDGLMTSPFSGREIIAGKLRGSLFALVPLVVAAVLSWTIALAFGAMPIVEYIALLGYSLVGMTFVVAVGVRASLTTPTATRAMTVTMAFLIASYAVLSLLTAVVMLVLMLLCFFAMMLAMQLGLTAMTTRPGLPSWFFPAGWNFLMLGSFLIFTLMIVSEMRMRFDQLAGRMPSEGMEKPSEPVWVASGTELAQTVADPA